MLGKIWQSPFLGNTLLINNGVERAVWGKLEVIMRKEPGQKDFVVWKWSLERKDIIQETRGPHFTSGWMAGAVEELREGQPC